MDYLLEPFKMAAAAVGLRQRSGPVSPRAPPPKRSREEGSKRAQSGPADQQKKDRKRRRTAEEEDSLAAVKAEERGLRERLGEEGYKEDVLRKASLPDLKYYVGREDQERDPNYPSGRVERQAYVQQLHEKRFDNWGELTPANLAKPQRGKDGEEVYRNQPEFIGGKRRAKYRRSSSKRRRTRRRRTKRRRKKSRKHRKKRRTRRR